MKKQKVAFAMVRQQPMTNGHFDMYCEMARDNDIVIIGYGSVGAPIDIQNPWDEIQRMGFFKKAFGRNSKDKFKLVPIRDIGAEKEEDWQFHCMKKIDELGLPTPTTYYAGSETDLHWFVGAENLNGDLIKLVNMNRHKSGHMSGTQVRQSLAMGTDEWKQGVPGCLVEDIERTFPERLTLKYQQEKKAEARR